MKKTHRIFIAATKQNDGKTTISLGLINAFKKKIKRVGFIKPVGQRYVLEEGHKIDEDSVLIERTCGMRCCLKDMSPVAIERGFTQRYIEKGTGKQALIKNISSSFNRVSKNKDLVIIEGTGHAGVGSVFDLSNAQVANLLEAKVILIASGGVGRPIDEIELNMALFEKYNVEVIGVIINKVLPSKYKKISRILKKALKRKGIPVLGIIPFITPLSIPTIRHIVEETDIKLISKKVGLDNKVQKTLIGAMEPHDALDYIENESLLITPGDREDLIMTVLSAHLLKRPKKHISISGIILTGGIVPHPKIKMLIEQANIPVLLSQTHTYLTASQIHDLAIKIRPEDKEKPKIANRLVERYVDIPRILQEIEL